jgi:hypothetical protein
MVALSPILEWIYLLYFRYEEDTELFKQKVADTVALSKEKSKEPVKSDDPHTIR